VGGKTFLAALPSLGARTISSAINAVVLQAARP